METAAVKLATLVTASTHVIEGILQDAEGFDPTDVLDMVLGYPDMEFQKALQDYKTVVSSDEAKAVVRKEIEKYF